MKYIFLFFILFFSWSLSYSQKIYYSKREYDIALKNYNEELDSYLNYKNKINFYLNFKYPPKKYFPKSPDEWSSYLKPFVIANGIIYDNMVTRYHKNVKPIKLIYINFYSPLGSDTLFVNFSDERMRGDCLYSADTYSFKNPGDQPIFSDYFKIKKGSSKPKIVKVPAVNITESNTKEVKIIYTPKRYTMPDGGKYTYEELIKAYPSMGIPEVFNHYFGE